MEVKHDGGRYERCALLGGGGRSCFTGVGEDCVTMRSGSWTRCVRQCRKRTATRSRSNWRTWTVETPSRRPRGQALLLSCEEPAAIGQSGQRANHRADGAEIWREKDLCGGDGTSRPVVVAGNRQGAWRACGRRQVQRCSHQSVDVQASSFACRELTVSPTWVNRKRGRKRSGRTHVAVDVAAASRRCHRVFVLWTERPANGDHRRIREA